MSTIIQNKCASCHNSTKKNGGLDLSDLSLLTEDQGTTILQRIIHTDPSLRMPLKPDLSPGEPLSPEEVAAFYVVAYGPAAQQPARKE
jgi:mono/diheme cytochrome c family protein